MFELLNCASPKGITRIAIIYDGKFLDSDATIEKLLVPPGTTLCATSSLGGDGGSGKLRRWFRAKPSDVCVSENYPTMDDYWDSIGFEARTDCVLHGFGFHPRYPQTEFEAFKLDIKISHVGVGNEFKTVADFGPQNQDNSTPPYYSYILKENGFEPIKMSTGQVV